MIRTSKKKGNFMREDGGRASLAWKENLRISPVACYKKKPRMGILIATYSPSRVTLEKAVLVADRIVTWRSPGNFFSQTQSPCNRRLRNSVLKTSRCKVVQGAPISTDPVTQNTSVIRQNIRCKQLNVCPYVPQVAESEPVRKV